MIHKDECCEDSLVKKTPKAEQRCQIIVDVAYRLFLDKGYENVSMHDIVKLSGGSLSTLYKHFGNKAQLLIYVLEQKSDELFGDWSRYSKSYEGKLEAFLMMIGKSYLDLIVDDDSILFNRLIASLGYVEEIKSVNKMLLDVMMHPINVLSSYLENEKKHGRLDVKDTTLCAHQFLNCLEEPFMFPRILGVETDISEEKRKQALMQVVSIFMRGIAS